MARISQAKPCAFCGEPSVARDMCATHYKRWQRHGHVEWTRPNDWGLREKHPLYHSWKWASKKTAEGVVPEWEEFWTFVNDVGERPGPFHRLRRKDVRQPYGPENCYWAEGTPNSDAADRQRAWRAKNPARAKGYGLKRAYGITLEEYDAMLREQGGVCAICGNPEKTSQNGFSLAVDHCHETKNVRGLLCMNCNRGLGHFEDNPELLAKAIQYLEKG